MREYGGMTAIVPEPARGRKCAGAIMPREESSALSFTAIPETIGVREPSRVTIRKRASERRGSVQFLTRIINIFRENLGQSLNNDATP
jgi:hypothetical protein